MLSFVVVNVPPSLMRRVLRCTTLWVVMWTNVQIMLTVVRMVISHVSSACPVSVRVHVSKSKPLNNLRWDTFSLFLQSDTFQLHLVLKQAFHQRLHF